MPTWTCMSWISHSGCELYNYILGCNFILRCNKACTYVTWIPEYVQNIRSKGAIKGPCAWTFVLASTVVHQEIFSCSSARQCWATLEVKTILHSIGNILHCTVLTRALLHCVSLWSILKPSTMQILWLITALGFMAWSKKEIFLCHFEWLESLLFVQLLCLLLAMAAICICPKLVTFPDH